MAVRCTRQENFSDYAFNLHDGYFVETSVFARRSSALRNRSSEPIYPIQRMGATAYLTYELSPVKIFPWHPLLAFC
jgi:hypothetical protein